MSKAEIPSLTKSLLVLESRKAILALAPLLEQLAARCGQPGAMHWLPYFLDPAVLGRRSPRLVLFLSPEEHAEQSLSLQDLRAAVLCFEYMVCGLGTGVVATADAVGFNSVIAPPGERATIAAAAAHALTERGAAIVLATYESAGETDFRRASTGWTDLLWTKRYRSIRRSLPLQSTLEETLASMGKSTRFNLRYYRRRLEAQMRCEFVVDAAPLLHGADLEAINTQSLNPVEPAEFARRVHCASTLPGSFLCGLRDPEGRWLSLVGGWRQGATTVLHWQMNASGYEKRSLGTVMRCFFLEAEIGRGARDLLIFGGTPHTMRHAFAEDDVADLVVRRAGLRSFTLSCGARLLLASPLLGRGNFVAETLCDKSLVWQRSGEVLKKETPLLVEPVRARRPA